MIDGAVGLIVLVAVLRGAIKGVGDTVIKILCIVVSFNTAKFPCIIRIPKKYANK